MNIKYKFNIGKLLTTYLPMLCSLIVIVHCVYNFYGNDNILFSYIGGTSIIVWFYFLWNSYLYNLCIHQKMFIYYLIFSNSISIIDFYIGIPISTRSYLLVYFISFGITVLLYGYFKFRENKNKKHPRNEVLF